ncbi:hypothetical protein TTRE_0000716401 [Trichuris trichiura]|uniref:Uncharacterized protein n=1 Tax=Trichuris trichiura TaxID=36087 RepID=A0A077ZGR3_TRITR|nr:hypothetical protein TTRE_0000716401 [Trichuris trichiura]
MKENQHEKTGETKHGQGEKESLPSAPARPKEPAEAKQTAVNSQGQQKIEEGPVPNPTDREPIAAMPAAVTPASNGERPIGEEIPSTNTNDNKEPPRLPSQEPLEVAEGPTPKPVDTEPIAAEPAVVTANTNGREPLNVDNKPTIGSADVDEELIISPFIPNTTNPPLKKRESIFTRFLRWLSRIFYFL